MELWLVLGMPLLGALVLALLGARRYAAEVNIVVSLATLLAASLLVVRVICNGPLLVGHEQFFVDPFNVFLVALTAFVGLTTAIFSRPVHAYRRTSRPAQCPAPAPLPQHVSALHGGNVARVAHQQYGADVGGNGGRNAIHGPTGLAVQNKASLEAAWKYFILCGVGIAQALFGTILLYFAAERTLGRQGMTALLWTHLNAAKADLEPRVMGLAFVFLLVGYGTKVGLAPLHNWLPDAHAEGPTPVSAVLSGLLLNVALYAVIRCKILAEGSVGASLPGRMLMTFGLLSAVLAAFFLWRQRDIKRLFGYSSIEHMGIITFAFGLGGPVANFAALLHMTVHSLTKSSIFFTAGHASQTSGTQQMDGFVACSASARRLAGASGSGSLAILGMPPFGVFASEFLILTTAMREHPWATPILLIALGVAFAGIFMKVQPMAFGESDAPNCRTLLRWFRYLFIWRWSWYWVSIFLLPWQSGIALQRG